MSYGLNVKTIASKNAKIGEKMLTILPVSYEIDNVNIGVRKVYEFANGYGASVIMSLSSYGGKDGLWEIMALKGGELDYTNDVVPYGATGHLTDVEVEAYLTQIAAL